MWHKIQSRSLFMLPTICAYIWGFPNHGEQRPQSSETVGLLETLWFLTKGLCTKQTEKCGILRISHAFDGRLLTPVSQNGKPHRSRCLMLHIRITTLSFFFFCPWSWRWLPRWYKGTPQFHLAFKECSIKHFSIYPLDMHAWFPCY